jgi:hypothetical protein
MRCPYKQKHIFAIIVEIIQIVCDGWKSLEMKVLNVILVGKKFR